MRRVSIRIRRSILRKAEILRIIRQPRPPGSRTHARYDRICPAGPVPPPGGIPSPTG
jgi:hypothetical protein